MQHARDDYNRIQDPLGKIPANEPVFLLRGQDLATPIALEAYAKALELMGAKPTFIKAVRDHNEKIMAWQQTVKAKTPDMPDFKAGGPVEENLVPYAITILREQMKDKTPGSIFYAWQSNIAMAFKDQFINDIGRGEIATLPELSEVANKAAFNFLNMLFKE